ncbi:hypothetical protein L6452_11264 [Arctium lappa]|uniref:Uncharacterized protein n=1 Tax=Arctium lappa TaxID=4217 RepID=A0ACB9DPD7_ARCLA|nr:hypothetical protein L6452_11264 [Arctium lappa]
MQKDLPAVQLLYNPSLLQSPPGRNPETKREEGFRNNDEPIGGKSGKVNSPWGLQFSYCRFHDSTFMRN